MDNRKNLKPLNRRTTEEQRKFHSLGGIASGEARRHNRDMKQIVEKVLSLPYAKGEKLVNGFSELLPGKITIHEAIFIVLCKKALGGDVSAIKLLLEVEAGKYDKIKPENIVDGDIKSMVNIYLPDNQREEG